MPVRNSSPDPYQDLPVVRATPNYEKRVLPGGFVQHRRIGPRGGRGPWMFYVCGFSNGSDEGTATLLAEPHKQRVPIRNGRLFLLGRWWGRSTWDH